jgi:2-dehydropantoate 2-reductase
VKILVVAAGAVGSVLGARLFQAGHDVELVARSDHARAIRAHGLTIEGPAAGTFRLPAVDDIARAAAPARVIVAAKTFDLARVGASLGTRFPSLPPTLLPQNGLHVERSLATEFVAAGGADPSSSLVRAVTFLGATLERPGVVRQVGDGELVFPGSGARTGAAGAGRAFLDLFATSSIRVRTVPDFERELWRKTIVNAAVNPVTALNGIVNGRLLAEPYRESAHRLLREAQRAAALAGYPIPDSEADSDLDRVLRATAENRSSMLQDVDRGRSTEVEAISGEILRVASEQGVDLPETRAVVEQLRAREPTGASVPQPS